MTYILYLQPDGVKLVKSSYQIPDKLINKPIDQDTKNVHFEPDSVDISLVFKRFHVGSVESTSLVSKYYL